MSFVWVYWNDALNQNGFGVFTSPKWEADAEKATCWSHVGELRLLIQQFIICIFSI